MGILKRTDGSTVLFDDREREGADVSEDPALINSWLRRLWKKEKTSTSVFEIKNQQFLFHLASVLTDWFPRTGSWLLDSIIPPILGHRLLVERTFRKNLKIVSRVKQFKKILVVPDIHIGDTVMMQGAVKVFRDFFPEAQIDYAVKRSVAGLIEGNPSITRVFPCFTGTLLPSPSDFESVKKILTGNDYDFCFNGSSLFQAGNPFPRDLAVLHFLSAGPQLVRNGKDRVGINHFLYQSYSFMEDLLRKSGFKNHGGPFKGVPVTLSDEAFKKAGDFLRDENVPKNKPIVFLNPDTASPYTVIPVQYQVRIIQELLKMDCAIILAASFTFKDIGERILDSLTQEEIGKIFVLTPQLPIEVYAALIDLSDVFISGDTGPLHIAAARKVSKSGNIEFKNRTFVISVFGATPARMSGYDSTDPLFLPANQDAPSRTYISKSPCRNITCLNKMVKTCKTPRCFEVLDVDAMVEDIKTHLGSPTKKKFRGIPEPIRFQSRLQLGSLN